jgi:hypothetical protein
VSTFATTRYVVCCCVACTHNSNNLELLRTLTTRRECYIEATATKSHMFSLPSQPPRCLLYRLARYRELVRIKELKAMLS